MTSPRIVRAGNVQTPERIRQTSEMLFKSPRIPGPNTYRGFPDAPAIEGSANWSATTDARSYPMPPQMKPYTADYARYTADKNYPYPKFHFYSSGGTFDGWPGPVNSNGWQFKEKYTPGKDTLLIWSVVSATTAAPVISQTVDASAENFTVYAHNNVLSGKLDVYVAYKTIEAGDGDADIQITHSVTAGAAVRTGAVYAPHGYISSSGSNYLFEDWTYTYGLAPEDTWSDENATCLHFHMSVIEDEYYGFYGESYSGDERYTTGQWQTTNGFTFHQLRRSYGAPLSGLDWHRFYPAPKSNNRGYFQHYLSGDHPGWSRVHGITHAMNWRGRWQ